ncbi:preprotein translocase subunit SecG [Rickettsia akari str. Hartford]|uniref:Preprotein translocase subunit SecG n=1 Tax=Rickettsia akari (strain Hartford) TaxID=293614 RepID=A8GM25_RICAH|nr:preprotein translocase subunit SecG [Rickettsia akari str. Hartford]
MRTQIINIVAVIPIVWYVGNIPINTVGEDMQNNALVKATLRPNLSPITPKNMPPNGLAK